MQRNDVVIVGSHVQGFFMNVPRFPGPDETVLGWDFKEALDGGKGSHQAIACGRLGLPAKFVGRVGNDRLGAIGASWLSEAGVDTSHLYRSSQTATGCGFIMINPDGIPAMTTAMGANSEFSHEDLDNVEHVFSHARLVLITLEIPLSTALYAAQLAKKHGAFTILTPGPAEPVPADGFANVDLLVPNENEASTLLNEPASVHEPRWLAERLQNVFGLKQVIVTLGEKGAYVANGDVHRSLSAFKVSAVESPGAGDCFTGALAFGLYHGASLVDAATFGCLASARSVTVPGSFPSFGTLSEVAEFAKANQFDLPPGTRALLDATASYTANEGRNCGIEGASKP
jgi:ribokinase